MQDNLLKFTMKSQGGNKDEEKSDDVYDGSILPWQHDSPCGAGSYTGWDCGDVQFFRDGLINGMMRHESR